MTMRERLSWLVSQGKLAGFYPPHANEGLAGGMLPWVLMPHPAPQPAKLCYTNEQLEAAVVALETHGPWGLRITVPA